MKKAMDKFFNSIVPGVLAGLLVIAGSIVFLTDVSGPFAILVQFVVLILTVVPALIGLFVSFFVRYGKSSNGLAGFLHILFGLILSLGTPPGVGTFVRSYDGLNSYWLFTGMAIIGGIIFFISGVYLVIDFRRRVHKVSTQKGI